MSGHAVTVAAGGEAMTLTQLRELGRAKLAGLRFCACGFERQPRRMLVAGLSLLVCGRCGGLTTERKEA